MIRRSPALVVVMMTAAACAPGGGQTRSVTVEDAVCRPTPNGMAMTACYMTIETGQDDRLLSVQPSVGRAELHTMSTEGGVMRMSPLPDGLALKARRAAALRPGGDHLMLLDLPGPLAEGDTVNLTFTFQSGLTPTAEATVGAPATGGGHGGH